MGKDKSFLLINGKPIIENTINILENIFSEIIISTNSSLNYKYLGYKIIEDEIKNKGPLIGIYSALKISSNIKNFVIASDIPKINIEFLNKLIEYSDEYEIVIPYNIKGYEPLFAIYDNRIINKIENLIEIKQYKIIELLKICKVKTIYQNLDNWYININTQEQYKNYISNKNRI